MSHALHVADEAELDVVKAEPRTGMLAGHVSSAVLNITLSIGHGTVPAVQFCRLERGYGGAGGWTPSS